MKRFFALLFLALVCALLLCGCTVTPKTFEKGGMSITLTSAFSELKQEGLTVAYESKKAVVLVYKENFETLASVNLNADSTVEEYAAAVLKAQQLDGTTVQSENGLTYFTYERSAGRSTYAYFVTVHKSASAIWLIQFGCATDELEEMYPSFVTYAQSISFTE